LTFFTVVFLEEDFTMVFLEEDPFFLVAVATTFFLGAVFFAVGLHYWVLWYSYRGLPSLACFIDGILCIG
jgi:hypothetical protein